MADIPTIGDLRSQYPMYGELNDQDFVEGFRNRFYPEIEQPQFFGFFGLTPATAPFPEPKPGATAPDQQPGLAAAPPAEQTAQDAPPAAVPAEGPDASPATPFKQGDLPPVLGAQPLASLDGPGEQRSNDFPTEPPADTLIDRAGRGVMRSVYNTKEWWNLTDAETAARYLDAVRREDAEPGMAPPKRQVGVSTPLPERELWRMRLSYRALEPEAKEALKRDLQGELTGGIAGAQRARQQSQSYPAGESTEALKKEFEGKKLSDTTFDDIRKIGSALAQDPVGMAVDVFTESLIPSAAMAVPGIGGGVAMGRLGAMLGAGLGSVATEYMSAIGEVLKDRGVDVTNADQVAAAFANQELMRSVRQDRMLQAVPTGIFDALAFGLATKTLGPGGAGPVVREGVNLIAQSQAQGALGAAGAAAGKLARGQEPEPLELFFEYLGEQPGMAFEVAGARSAIAGNEAIVNRAKLAADLKASVKDPVKGLPGATTQDLERVMTEAYAIMGGNGSPQNVALGRFSPEARDMAQRAGLVVNGMVPYANLLVAGRVWKARQNLGRSSLEAAAAAGTPVIPDTETMSPETGSAAAPAVGDDGLAIDLAAGRANQEPTDGQKEAGNYQKGHYSWNGLDISIETPKGAMRRGTGADGQPWEAESPAHYGYIRRTEGGDGEQVDVYMGPQPDSKRIFVVDQIDPATGQFDEHKVVLGTGSFDAAMDIYEESFSDGSAKTRARSITEMSLDEFRKWLRTDSTTSAEKQPTGEPYGEVIIDGINFPDQEHAEFYQLGKSGAALKPDQARRLYQWALDEDIGEIRGGLTSTEDIAGEVYAIAQDIVDLVEEHGLRGQGLQIRSSDRQAELYRKAGVQPRDGVKVKAQPPSLKDAVDGIEVPASIVGVDLSKIDVGVDPKRFQFKGGTDESGVSERLQGIKKWEPQFANLMVMWEDESGRFWIADGHQRLGLARRLMKDGHAPITVNAVVLRAKDGITDAEARKFAAQKNLAEGTGTAVDAAKVIRESGSLVDNPSMPQKGAVVKQSTALAKLGPEAFGAVVNGVVPEAYGAIVGELLQDPQQQMAAIGVLNQVDPANEVQARSVVEQVREAGFQQGDTGDMFGSAGVQQSLYGERARVLDTTLKILRRDRSLFKTLVDKSSAIVEAGNVLAGDANQPRLEGDEAVLQQIQTLANRKGPISDALNQAATALAGGKPVGTAARQFIAAIRDGTGGRDSEVGKGDRGLPDGSAQDRPDARPDAAPAPDAAQAGGERGGPGVTNGDIFRRADAEAADTRQKELKGRAEAEAKRLVSAGGRRGEVVRQRGGQSFVKFDDTGKSVWVPSKQLKDEAAQQAAPPPPAAGQGERAASSADRTPAAQPPASRPRKPATPQVAAMPGMSPMGMPARPAESLVGRRTNVGLSGREGTIVDEGPRAVTVRYDDGSEEPVMRSALGTLRSESGDPDAFPATETDLVDIWNDVEVRFATTPEGKAAREAVQRVVDSYLSRIAPGLAAVVTNGLKYEGREIWGAYNRDWNQLQMHLALVTLTGGTRTASHETIHFLRRAGYIKPEEWAVLERAAANWKTIFGIGDTAYAGAPESLQLEEAIAEAFSAWAHGDATAEDLFGAGPDRAAGIAILEKIRMFLRRIMDALRGTKTPTAESVFEAIERGEVGSRRPAGDMAWDAEGAIIEQEGPTFSEKPDDRRQAELVFGDNSGKVPTVGGREVRAARAAVASAAKKLGLSPEETQAALWSWTQIEGNADAEKQLATLGATAQAEELLAERKAAQGEGAAQPGVQPGERAAEGGAQGRDVQAAEERAGADGGRAGDTGAAAQPGRGVTDRTDQGEQFVLPGAERIGQRQLLERRSAGGLKPKAVQKSASDLFQALPEPQKTLLSSMDPRTVAERLKAYAQAVKDAATNTTRADGVVIRRGKTYQDLTIKEMLGEWVIPPDLLYKSSRPEFIGLVKKGMAGEIAIAKYIDRLNDRWDTITGKLEPAQFQQVFAMLWLGDAEQVRFSQDQLDNIEALGLELPDGSTVQVSGEVIEAYKKARSMLDGIGRMIDTHRRNMKPKWKMERDRLRAAMHRLTVWTDPGFRKLYAERTRIRRRLQRGVLIPGPLEARLVQVEHALDTIRMTSPEYAALESRLDEVVQRLAGLSVRKNPGYVPHVFVGNWRVYQIMEDAEQNVRQVPVAMSDQGFYDTMEKALAAAKKYAADNGIPTDLMVVAPKEFQYPGDGQKATTVNDRAYAMFVRKMEDLTGLKGKELFEKINDPRILQRRFRRRLASFLMERKGVEGFSKQGDRVVRFHIGNAVRYMMLDRFKHDAIEFQEKHGLSPYMTHSDQPSYQAMVDRFLRDYNGQKSSIEEAIDGALEHFRPVSTALWTGLAMTVGMGLATESVMFPAAAGAGVAWAVYRGMTQHGDFKARGITGEAMSLMAHMKLGSFVNVASAVTNMSQTILNTYPVLGERWTTVGMARAGKAFFDQVAKGDAKDRGEEWQLLRRIGVTFTPGVTESSPHHFDKPGRSAIYSLMLFNTVETSNRAIAYLGGYYRAIDAGASHAAALQAAEDVVTRTQFRYGMASKPAVLRNWLGRMLFQFKYYMVRQLAFVLGLRNMEIPRFLLGMGLLSGVLGLPFIGIADWLIKLLTRKASEWTGGMTQHWSLINAVKEWAINQQANGWGVVSNQVARGTPTLFGIDMSDRTGMGERFFPQQWSDLQGPTVGTVLKGMELADRHATFADQVRNITPAGASLKLIEGLAGGRDLADAVKDPFGYFGDLARTASGDGRFLYTNPWKKGDVEWGLQTRPNKVQVGAMAAGFPPLALSQLRDITAVKQYQMEEGKKKRVDLDHELVRAAIRYGLAERQDLEKLGEVEDRLAARAEALGAPYGRGSMGRIVRDALTERAARDIKGSPKHLRPQLLKMYNSVMSHYSVEPIEPDDEED